MKPWSFGFTLRDSTHLKNPRSAHPKQLQKHKVGRYSNSRKPCLDGGGSSLGGLSLWLCFVWKRDVGHWRFVGPHNRWCDVLKSVGWNAILTFIVRFLSCSRLPIYFLIKHSIYRSRNIANLGIVIYINDLQVHNPFLLVFSLPGVWSWAKEARWRRPSYGRAALGSKPKAQTLARGIPRPKHQVPGKWNPMCTAAASVLLCTIARHFNIYEIDNEWSG